MNFTEILYQSTYITIGVFISRYLINRFIIKKNYDINSVIGETAGSLVFIFIMSMAINYALSKYVSFESSPTQQNKVQAVAVSGQSFKAPVSCDVQLPLKRDVEFQNFADDQEQITVVKTDLAEYSFSTNAATLQSIKLFWQNGTKEVELLPLDSQQFVLAVDGVTPVNYKLVSEQPIQDGNAHEVVYQATYGRSIIQKKFVVYKNTYQIDVHATLEKLAQPEQVRLLISAPKMQEELVGIVNAPQTSDQISLTTINLDKTDLVQEFWFEPKVFGFSSKFFTTVCFVASPLASGRVYFKELQDKRYQAIFESKECLNSSELSWSFYCGPKTFKDLSAVSPVFPEIISYGFLGFLAKPLARALDYTQQHTGNYGMAIILVALLIKLLMLPFTLRSERGLKQQAEFEKKRQYLQQKFKHDKAALDQVTAELIQKHGLPIFSGCLPMLLNIPVFIALNKVLTTSTELYGASFLWLPDLSAADPYYILSCFIFVGMIFAPGIQAGPRQMFSRIGLALFLAAATAYLASGLALFIVLNTLFGIVQGWAVRNISWLRVRYS